MELGMKFLGAALILFSIINFLLLVNKPSKVPRFPPPPRKFPKKSKKSTNQ